MNTKHPIDELFRNNLENHEPPFREEDWKEAAQLLDKNPLTAIAGNFWKWFGIISAFVVISGLAGFYFVMNQQDKNTASTDALPTNTTLITSQNNAQQSSGMPESSEMILKPSNEKKEVRKQSNIEDPAGISTSASGSEETTIESSSPSGSNNQQIISQKHDATKSSIIIDTISGETISENISIPSPGISANKKPSIEFKTSKAATAAAPNYGLSEDNSPAKKIMSPTVGNPSNVIPVSTSAAGADEKISYSNSVFQTAGNTAIKNSPAFLDARSIPDLQLIPLREISLDHQFIDENLSPINFNPAVSNNFLHQRHWSPFTSLEASLTGGATLISVPQIKSVQPGIEWNALLNYRLNNFIAGTGMGQFSVKEKFELSTDSITMSSYEVPVITIVDSFWVYDSTIIIIDSIPILVFDSSYHYISDTTLQLITTSDTSTTTATYASSGYYVEIPLILGYRFNWLNSSWQISGGAAYGWYHGGKRFGLDSEGKVFSYKPGSVVSFIGRVGVQYPLAEKIFLQGYLGGRFVMGLNADHHTNNYLIFSAGGGILFRF